MGDLGGPYDAIVIGSGMSGLTAANLLAMRGWKVLVLEQHYRFGGYLQSFPLHRTPFDSGCHYVGALGEGQVFDRYLRYLGVRERIVARPLDPEGFDIFEFANWRFAMPAGYARLEARLSAQFPAERAAIAAFLEEIRREVEHFPMYTLAAGRDPRGRSPDPGRTVADVLVRSGVRDPCLRDALTSYRALYFVPPAEAPFAMHAFVFDSFVQGAYTVQGGGHAIARALLAQLRARGGTALRRMLVTGVEVADGAVRGVRTASGAFDEAPVVIAAIDPKVAVRLLPRDAVRPVYRNRIERLRPGIGGLAAYLRVEGDLSRFAPANWWVHPRAAPAGSPPEDPLFSESWLHDGSAPPVFLTVPSTREPSWKGPHAVVLLSGVRAEAFAAWSRTRTGVRPDDYEARKREIGARLIEAARPFMPELERGVVTADFATPLTHRDYTLNEGGAIYGVHHSVDQVGIRGVTWRTRVKGFLLSGHSVLYPGLLGATISAFYTCGELLGLDAMHREVLRA